MRLGVCVVAIYCCLLVTLFAATPPILNDPAAGQKLARKLADAAPDENATFRGVFELERRGTDDLNIPVTFVVSLTNGGWRVSYSVQLSSGVDTVSILHQAGKPSVYTYEATGRKPISMAGGQATNNFDGTDFALLDLGLEFLQWPTQVLVTKEMKKGRGCYVLESRPATTNLYSRVVSWLDEESADGGLPGLIMARAYDARGNLLKEFEVRQMKKVAGQWQVQEMELRNRQTKGSTRLRFEFDTK